MSVALALTVAGVAQARPRDPAQPPVADFMPLGAETNAPQGFLEMCQQNPQACVLDPQPSEAVRAEVRAWAGQTRWATLFQAAGMAVPSPRVAAVEMQPAPRLKTRQSVRRSKDAQRKRTLAPGSKAPRVPVPAPPPVPPAPVATLSIDQLERLNQRVNRAIRRQSDVDGFGRADVWRVPGGPRASGDCEDYALAKREALITAGVDPAALSIALAETRRGEAHAVLLVATARGEVVLDNLDPWVRPWREVGYRWRERQVPGRPRTWVQAAP